METDTPENEGPTPLRRTATDVEVHDLTTTTTSAIPNADRDLEMHPYPFTTPTITTLSASRTEFSPRITNYNIDTRVLLLILRTPHDRNSTYDLRRRRQALHIYIPRQRDARFDDRLPLGYGGLVLWREGNDAVNPVVGNAPVANIKGKSRAKPPGRPVRRGRS